MSTSLVFVTSTKGTDIVYLSPNTTTSSSVTAGSNSMGVIRLSTLSSFINGETHTGNISSSVLTTTSSAVSLSGSVSINGSIAVHSSSSNQSLTIGTSSNKTNVVTCYDSINLNNNCTINSSLIPSSVPVISVSSSATLATAGSTSLSISTSAISILNGSTSKMTMSSSDGSITSSGGTISGFSKVYNAVWNDYADLLKWGYEEDATPGKCYVIRKDGTYALSSKRCEKGTLGIASDTYSMIVGKDENSHGIPLAVSGFVLAYVDKTYDPGTPLVSTKDGYLTKARWYDMFHKERIVGTFLRREKDKIYKDLLVNNRSWIHV